MKYTFEIMKEYEDAFRGISVYSVSEDKKLMVDFVALEELEDAQKEIDEAYQRGVEDGRNETWEAVKKISLMSPDEIEKVFPGAAKYNRYNLGYSGVEAIEKLKAYEEKRKADNKFDFGDEIIDLNGVKGCVVSKDNEGYDTMYALFDGCRVPQYVTQSNYRKTGKHYDIDKILEEMRHD